MKRTELGAVEHGVALIVALALADLVTLAACSLIAGFAPTRGLIGWVISDAIPCGVAVALLGRRPLGWRGLPIALLAAVLVEAIALASGAAFEALQPRGLQPFGAILMAGLEGVYGSRMAALVAVCGRALSICLAARLRGHVGEGGAFAAPQGAAWMIGLALRTDSGTPGAEVAGAIAFTLALSLLVPILERATVRTFRALGISDDGAPG